MENKVVFACAQHRHYCGCLTSKKHFSCLSCIFDWEFINFCRKLGVLFSEISNSELQCISLLSYLFQLCGISLIFVGVGRPRHRWNLLWHSTTEVGNLVGDVSHIWWCCGWNYLFPIYRGWEILQGSCSRLAIKGYVLRGSLLQKHFLASWSRHNQRHEGLHQTQQYYKKIPWEVVNFQWEVLLFPRKFDRLGLFQIVWWGAIGKWEAPWIHQGLCATQM